MRKSIVLALLIAVAGCDRPTEETPAGEETPTGERERLAPAPELPLEAAPLQDQRDHLAQLGLWDVEGHAPPA